MLENGALSAGRFHDLMFKALVGITFCLGMVNAIPVQAETFVRYHSELSKVHQNDYVYNIDLDSIRKHGKYTFFKTRTDTYKVDPNNIKTYQFKGSGIHPYSVAVCRNEMISRLGLDSPVWKYRQSNGEWWLVHEVKEGHRKHRNSTPWDKKYLKHLGYTSYYDYMKANDEHLEKLFTVVCA